MHTNRSSFRKMSPNTLTVISVGRQEHVQELNPNPYLKTCTTLQSTAHMLYELYENPNDAKYRSEVYRKLYEFVNRDMKPSFDEIDDMLLVCRILLDNECRDELEEFILNCPIRFIVTFVNNSDKSPSDFQTIKKWGLTGLYNYLLNYVHNSKLATWNV